LQSTFKHAFLGISSVPGQAVANEFAPTSCLHRMWDTEIVYQ